MPENAALEDFPFLQSCEAAMSMLSRTLVVEFANKEQLLPPSFSRIFNDFGQVEPEPVIYSRWRSLLTPTADAMLEPIVYNQKKGAIFFEALITQVKQDLFTPIPSRKNEMGCVIFKEKLIEHLKKEYSDQHDLIDLLQRLPLRKWQTLLFQAYLMEFTQFFSNAVSKEEAPKEIEVEKFKRSWSLSLTKEQSQFQQALVGDVRTENDLNLILQNQFLGGMSQTIINAFIQFYPMNKLVTPTLFPEVSEPFSPEVSEPFSPEVSEPLFPEVSEPFSPEVKAIIAATLAGMCAGVAAGGALLLFSAAPTFGLSLLASPVIVPLCMLIGGMIGLTAGVMGVYASRSMHSCGFFSQFDNTKSQERRNCFAFG